MRRFFGRGRTPFEAPRPGTREDPLLLEHDVRLALENTQAALVMTGRMTPEQAGRVTRGVRGELDGEPSLGELTRLISREIWHVEHGTYAGWEESLAADAQARQAEAADRARVLYEQGEALKREGRA